MIRHASAGSRTMRAERLEPDSVVLVGGTSAGRAPGNKSWPACSMPLGIEYLFIPTKENVPASVTTFKRIPN